MNPTNEITFNGLGNPEQPIQTPPAQTSVEPLATFTAPTAQETQALNTAQTNANTSEQDYMDALFGGSTIESSTLKAEEKAGLPQLQTELTDITNQIMKTDLDFRREREMLQTEPGLTTAQRQARLADVTRKQSSQLADLEVIRSARSNTLTNAQSIIQKKVNAEFAEQEKNLNGLKFLAERADGKLKTQLDAVAKKEERAFNVAKSEFEKVENSKLEFVKNASLSGAPNSVLTSIMQSKTIEEAIQRAGKYVADPIQLASLAKANMEMAKISAEIRAGGAGGFGGKPLSGDASKVLSIATTVQPEIEKLKQVFAQNYKKSVKGIVLGTDRELVKLVDNVADKVGRLRSGGAINKEEETRFKRQIASLMDIPFGTSEGAIMALDGILTEAQQVAQGINPYATQLEDAVNDPLGLGISITNENPLGI